MSNIIWLNPKKNNKLYINGLRRDEIDHLRLEEWLINKVSGIVSGHVEKMGKVAINK